MRKTVVLSVAGLLTLVLFVGYWMTSLRLNFDPPAEAMQEPPCGSTSRNQKSLTRCGELSSSNLPTVSFCDLLHNEARYKHQIIRTEAKLDSESGGLGLRDAACDGEGMVARVDFDTIYGIAPEAQKAFDQLLCLPRSYYKTKEAEVIVVGRFDGLDGKPGDRYRTFQFVVMCIQQAKNQRLKNYGT